MNKTRDGLSLKVLMIPYLAHSHASSFLGLAKRLSLSTTFSIYICSTPIVLNKSIKPKILSSTTTTTHDPHGFAPGDINLIELELPSSPDFPPHHHTTNGLPPHLISTLRDKFKMAGPKIVDILETLKPDLLIYDIFQPWLFSLASSQNIPAISLSTCGAASSSFLYYSLKIPDYMTSYPFPETIVYPSESDDALEDNFSEHLAFPVVESSRDEITLMRSSRAVEGKYIDFLSSIYTKKVVVVGPLVEELEADHNHDHGQTSNVIEWLSNKEESSTVYISFGSEAYLTENEIKELAHGLEISDVNFIWVMRPPNTEEALPEGFVERVIKSKGMIIKGWASQTKILRHPSVGGFLSHCGWGSVMEGMVLGIPIIAMPLHHDQPSNAKLVVEDGVGLEVMREKNGEINREEVASVIMQVMEKNSSVKVKAKEMSERIRKEREEEEKEYCLEKELIKVCDKYKKLFN